MFSPVPLINRIDRLKESETRISLDDIWDYPVRPQRFSMWSTQPPHLRNTPALRAAGRGIQHRIPSSLPSSSPVGTGKNEATPPNQPRALPSSPTRATLPSALRFATSHPPSPPCALVRRSAQHGRRSSPITSRGPRGPQKAGPSDARPSSLKWRIPVHTAADQAGVVPSIVISPPDDAGKIVCPSSSSPSSGSNVAGEKETNKEETRTHYLRRTTTRILGPAKSQPSPGSTSRCDQPNSTSSQPLDDNPDPRYSAPETEEDFTLPEDYASTLRLSIVHCPRRKRAWRVVERCLDGVWRRVGW
ncbi:hypothetical protein KC331_g10233 [Hortaea werneckii]|nr:hypothetical protein KC331_g10233 [Hortaea werneckii]KAI7701144.1 hypothetical protein KC353_g15490 [Hortaea werneckii]